MEIALMERILLTRLLEMDDPIRALEAFVTIRADLSNIGNWTVENIVVILMTLDLPQED